MKSLLLTPLIWLASLAFVVVVHILFAWDDWRVRRLSRSILRKA